MALRIGRETPQEGGKRTLPLDQRTSGPRISDHRLDLAAMAHDRGIGTQPGDIRLTEAGKGKRIKVLKGAPQMPPLAQDQAPGKPGLEALKTEFLEQQPIVRRRPAPFRIVIGLIERIAHTPKTAPASI